MGFETILMNLYKPETTEHHSSYYNTMQVSISTRENSYLKKEMYKWCYIELKKKQKKTAQEKSTLQTALEGVAPSYSPDTYFN